jgi:hypothetical protein
MSSQPSWRGRSVSRIEGFSDAVFAFALTLLVVSLEVPTSFGDLVETMQGFLAFAICFAFIVWVWFEHYLFFRRFGLEDGWTIVLNALLLFVVLFYVYPLKFLFTGLVRGATGLGPAGATVGAAAGDGRRLMLVYSLGFVAVFLGLALLHLHAWRRRDDLAFDALERHDAKAGITRHLATTAVGVLSILLALVLPERQVGFAGMFYAVLGPVHALLGYRLGSRRAALRRAAATPAVATTPPATAAALPPAAATALPRTEQKPTAP